MSRHPRESLSALVLFFLVVASTAAAQPRVGVPNDLPLPLRLSDTRDIVLADVDADGDLDAFVAGSASTLLIQQTSCRFVEASPPVPCKNSLDLETATPKRLQKPWSVQETAEDAPYGARTPPA